MCQFGTVTVTRSLISKSGRNNTQFEIVMERNHLLLCFCHIPLKTKMSTRVSQGFYFFIQKHTESRRNWTEISVDSFPLIFLNRTQKHNRIQVLCRDTRVLIEWSTAFPSVQRETEIFPLQTLFSFWCDDDDHDKQGREGC